MAGIFPKDIWTLLFRHYIDFKSVVVLKQVSKRMSEFMTPEQRQALQILHTEGAHMFTGFNTTMNYYRNIAENQAASISKNGKYAICGCCGKARSHKRIVKHQRMCALNLKIQSDRTVCGICGLKTPFVDHQHRGIDGTIVCPLETGRCSDCNGLMLRPYLIHHNCLMAPIECKRCGDKIPTVFLKFHVCARMCKFISPNGITCKGLAIAGFCKSHSRPRCSVRMKNGRMCSRASNGITGKCTQHRKSHERNRRV